MYMSDTKKMDMESV